MKEKQAILDGKFVPISEINPLKHTLIGTFRTPNPPCSDPTVAYAEHFLCDCGMVMSFRDDIRKHWQDGCMDIFQYKTIE
jgi:hypothetical protein